MGVLVFITIDDKPVYGCQRNRADICTWILREENLFMGIALSKLMKDIGTAVQNANAAIEERAVDVYLNQGYRRGKEMGEDGGTSFYTPVTYTLGLPAGGGNKKLEVPATALMHHSTLQLEQVNVKLRFLIEESDGEEVEVKVKSEGDDSDMYSVSELSMQFRTAPPAEGTARVENHHLRAL